LKGLFLRSLLVAILVGPAIGLVSKVASLQGGTKYESPLSADEFHQMGNMTVNEMEAALPKGKLR
jgi:hypothetical protein